MQPDLLARATRLRLAALRAQRLPQLALSGQATVQNAVPEIPIDLPGQAVPRPPREQIRAQVEADWTLYDGERVARQADAEEARYAEEVAGVAVTLYRLREATTEAFFGALLFDAQADVLALTAEDLDARLRVVQRQAEEGAALAADAAALEAERLRIEQAIAEAEAGRGSALAVLADLTGLPIEPAALALPDLDAETARALAALAEADVAAGRPERVRFARAADRAEAEARAVEATTRPSVSLFGQAGVGRPSPFDLFASDVAEFGIAGVRVRWPLFDGGRARRSAEALRVQADIAETEAAAFDRQVVRDVADERAALTRLDAALDADRRIVALREEVLRAARRQLDEGVLLPDRYTDRLTDLAEARLTLARHRIERAQAQARLLSDARPLPRTARPRRAYPRPELTMRRAHVLIDIGSLLLGVLIALVLFGGCGDGDEPDAYGNFEATEVTVSAEAQGRLLRFDVDEGDRLAQGAVVGLIDTTQLGLQRRALGAQRQSLLAQRQATLAQEPEVAAQAGAFRAQLETASEELARTQRLFADEAATARELNQREGEVAVLRRQIEQATARGADRP